jgi:hypothetical protein
MDMPWKRGQRLHLVPPDEACPEAAEVYSQMRAALGVPSIDKLHQAYAVFPSFLQAHWERVQKVVGSEAFFRCADRLGADAYTRVHSYLKVHDIRSELKAAQLSEGARHEVRQCVDLFHRSSTYSLLLCSWQKRAFEGPVGSESSEQQPAAPIRVGHLPIIMREDAMAATTKKTLEDIRRGLDAPALDIFYVALARWPDLLCDFWKKMQAEMQSPMFDHCRQTIREHAEELCDELPGPLELTTVQLLELMDENEIGSMVRITDAFEKSLSALVLNVAWTRIGLEGGNGTSKANKQSSEEPTKPSAA